MPRALLIADEPGWSLDRNLRDMAAYLGGEFAFDYWYLYREQAPSMDRYDVIYAAHRWQLEGRVPLDRAVGSLRSEHFDPQRSGPPSMRDAAEVNRWRAFHTVTRRPYEAIKRWCPRLRYLPGPVDVRRFGARPRGGPVVASWAGDVLHARASGLRVKGLEEVIAPACRAAGVPLVLAEARTARVAADDMPAFYARGNVTLCASLFEGSSCAVMEALAAGHALLTTDVGDHRDIMESERRHFGDAGVLIVERSADAFAAALRSLTPGRVAEMGEINRREVAERWSWDAWRDGYGELLRGAARGKVLP